MNDNNLILKRISAFYVDNFVCIVIVFLIRNVSLKIENFDQGINSSNILGLYHFFCLIFYYIVSESYTKSTIGKKIFGIRVDFSKSKYNDFVTSIIRTFSRIIPFDLISFIFDKKGLLWHDKISNTQVIINR